MRGLEIAVAARSCCCSRSSRSCSSSRRARRGLVTATTPGARTTRTSRKEAAEVPADAPQSRRGPRRLGQRVRSQRPERTHPGRGQLRNNGRERRRSRLDRRSSRRATSRSRATTSPRRCLQRPQRSPTSTSARSPSSETTPPTTTATSATARLLLRIPVAGLRRRLHQPRGRPRHRPAVSRARARKTSPRR